MGSLCEQYLRRGLCGAFIVRAEWMPCARRLGRIRGCGEEVTKVRVQFSRILCAAILVLLMLPLDASTAAQSGTHKIIVDSKDVATLKQLTQSGAQLVVDYGSFSLWKTTDPQHQAVAARASVKTRDDFDVVHLRGGKSINTITGAPVVASAVQQSQTSDFQFWMVQFIGPIKPAWLAKLRKMGIEIVAYMPNNAYIVWADGAHLAQLQGLTTSDPTVQWTDAYHPAYRIAPALQSATVTQTAQLVPVTIQLYKTSNVQASLANLSAFGGKVFRQPENILNFVNISLEVPGNQVAAIAARADVFNIEPYAKPKKKDEVQGQIVAGNVTTSGGNVVPSKPGYLAWLTNVDNKFPAAADQYPIVDVVDDGIDNGSTNPLHPDFHQGGVLANPSRLVFNNNCTTDTLADGQAGHGNLNAGIVGAYNDKTGTPYLDGNGFDIGLGISPYGRVAGTKIFENGAGAFDESACGGTDAGTVLAAYNAGAQITSNSWGAPTGGAYDAEAQAYDALTRDATGSGSNSHQISHVFSAGNDGRSGGQTVGSPGTAKNVLTVGATESVRDVGVMDGCGSTGSATADDIANFSSRGPTADGRNKPDIVAPGTHIQGPASKDPTYDGSGVCGQPASAPDFRYYPDGQTLYTWSSGTSHSAPAVAGVASLVYNYYGRVIHPGQIPSPAMLKALILNAPRYLTGIDANDRLPSPNQGWGDANLGALFDNNIHRYVIDQTTTFTTTGETFVKDGIVADPNKPFHVSLVWTDAPGSTTGGTLVNDLNLEVTVGGQVFKGNVFSGANSAPGGMTDSANNVENVFLPANIGGPFTIKVTAANLAGIGVPGAAGSTNQDFALVVSNGDVTAAPNLGLASVTTSDTAGGNGNGVVEPGEKIALTVGLLNSGDAPATAVSGTLATSTGTVTFANQSASYGTLNPGTVGSNATAFIFTLSPSQTCGAPVNFSETIVYDGGLTAVIAFSVPTGTTPLHTASDVPKAIPDNSPVGATSTLAITAPGTVTKVTVTLSIAHTFDGDLTIQLISPAGTTVNLSDRNGGNGNFFNTVFDDDAPTPIASGVAPFNGVFRPDQPLSTLNGAAITGAWKLFVVDNAPVDIGSIQHWSLAVQSSVPACTVFPPPTVISINPTSGDKAGGAAVTIKGTNFGGATSVMFDNQPATNVTVVDSTTITTVTPAHAPGAVSVKVTTNGLTLTLPTQYTYGTVNPAPPPTRPGSSVSGSPAPVPSGRPAPSGPASNVLPAPAPPKR